MTLTEIVSAAGANNCVECGKCSAACSMASMYPDFSVAFSPRALVQNTLRRFSGLAKAPDPEWLKRCLQCGNCTRSCPEGVDCAGLIAALREEARRDGEGGFRFCSGCGREIMAGTVERWLEKTLETGKHPDELPGFLKKFAGGETADPARNDYRSLCAVCRRQAYAANNG
ncbi:MAG: 4Fe-4S dicluster domain-containing protein [Desulfovibrio sp.]|nr:4Fe-4S dicluster domain-containing protein [Desulfovibrio sp.]